MNEDMQTKDDFMKLLCEAITQHGPQMQCICGDNPCSSHVLDSESREVLETLLTFIKEHGDLIWE